MATSFVPLHIFITMVLLLPDPIVTDNKTHNLANLSEEWRTVGGEEETHLLYFGSQRFTSPTFELFMPHPSPYERTPLLDGASVTMCKSPPRAHVTGAKAA